MSLHELNQRMYRITLRLRRRFMLMREQGDAGCFDAACFTLSHLQTIIEGLTFDVYRNDPACYISMASYKLLSAQTLRLRLELVEQWFREQDEADLEQVDAPASFQGLFLKQD